MGPKLIQRVPGQNKVFGPKILRVKKQAQNLCIAA